MVNASKCQQSIGFLQRKRHNFILCILFLDKEENLSVEKREFNMVEGELFTKKRNGNIKNLQQFLYKSTIGAL